MGYHKRRIKKGTLGDFSKIEEEFEELTDAVDQNVSILVMCELCDLLGAIEEYIKRWNLNIEDLLKMKDLTKKAFLNGDRS